jgi:hypothetical protein
MSKTLKIFFLFLSSSVLIKKMPIDSFVGFSFCISRSIKENLVTGNRLEENQKSMS